MSPFEVIMLICFGASWPFSIYKTYKAKSVKGKSIYFILLVFVGYLSGVVHKILYVPDIVLVMYILNAGMVGIEIVLYILYSRRHSLEEQQKYLNT